jgi:hypothetical protein
MDEELTVCGTRGGLVAPGFTGEVAAASVDKGVVVEGAGATSGGENV